MRQALSISALAKNTGLTSKTLRYWERVGLLPKATQTHTGYRVFAPETTHYIDFILKAKSVGLTLSEMKRVIDLAHNGKNPCPEVVQWIDDKDRALEQQIHSLRALQRRLWRFRRVCPTSSVMTCAREDELCCLIEDLPNPRLPKKEIAMRKLYSLALVLLVALGAKATTVIAATCSGCPPCPLCK